MRVAGFRDREKIRVSIGGEVFLDATYHLHWGSSVNAIIFDKCCYQFRGVGMRPCAGEASLLITFHMLVYAGFEVYLMTMF